MALEGEVLLSSIDFEKVLDGKDIKITNRMLTNAYKDLAKAGSIFSKKKEPLLSFDYDKVYDLITDPDLTEKLVDSISSAENDIEGVLPEVTSSALGVIETLMPVNRSEDLFGEVILPPSDVELRKFNRQLAILDNPYRVYGLMGENMLTSPEVLALELFYPDLTKVMREKALNEAIENKDKLSRRLKEQLAIFLNVPALDRASVASLQEQYLAESEQPSSSKNIELQSQVPTTGQQLASETKN